MTPRDGSPRPPPTSEAPTLDDRTLDERDSAVDLPTAIHAKVIPRESASYAIGALLGRGGMGEVLLAHDGRIGREVAIKRMRATEPGSDGVARFLREARIQARLEHPAIVPVYDLGYDVDGQPYFTMKRLAGTTLWDLMNEHAAQPKLLRAFVEVCLAIDFAHTRGVIHRDLKPTNIMLGDFGEVYVLDWGLARVSTDREGAPPRSDVVSLAGQTQTGALLGTPGYMPPEQARGQLDLGPAADVYALGAILFELLAGEPLHPRGLQALPSTLARPTQAPANRCPERSIPPELDAACSAALAADPAARPAPRALAERVQEYLDGDRDVEGRRVLAQAQLALARAAFASADPARRGDAMHHAGRALALDPSSHEAASLVTRLMIEPPANLPVELARHIHAVDLAIETRAARDAVLVLASYFLCLPLLIWSGITNWAQVLGTYSYVGLLAAAAAWMYVRARPNMVVALLGSAIMLVLVSRLLGPFILVPAMISALTVAAISQPGLIDRPKFVISTGVAAFFAPLVLEALGVFGRTWDIDGASIVSRSTVLRLAGSSGAVLVISLNVAMIVVTGLFARQLARTRHDAQRRLEIQAWHLRKLLPADAPRA